MLWHFIHAYLCELDAHLFRIQHISQVDLKGLLMSEYRPEKCITGAF